MLNVFVISSDKRVKRLIEHFQPFFKTKIRQASDFDQGLKEVFENRPSMVFIQSTIDSVSGDTVARHIKSLLGSESPKIIFMDETPGGEKKGSSWCDDSLVINDSEEQFQEDFAALVARYHSKDWSKILGEKKGGASVRFAPGVDEEPVVDDTVPVQAGPGAPDREAAPFLRVEPPETAALQVSSGLASGAGMDVLSTGKGVCRESSSSDATFPPLAVSLPVKRKTGRYLALLTAILLLVIAGTWLYLYRTGVVGTGVSSLKDSAPVEAVREKGRDTVSTVQRNRGIVALPSFVLSGSRDLSFSKERPGWERYLLPDYEIRVFRERGLVKALQVIARKDAGIPDSFLHSAMRELGYFGPLPTGTEKMKDGFLVKSVIVDGFAELVTYRKHGAANLEAFILEFS